MSQNSAIGNIAERLLELGVSGTKKTFTPIRGILKTAAEQITGQSFENKSTGTEKQSSTNYTSLNSPDMLSRLQKSYDKDSLAKA
ncbi:MAG: hypothetical protein ACMG6E_06475, partial [Candidatus Roizmanbacteria bacterium]